MFFLDQANSWIKLQFPMTETSLQLSPHHVLCWFLYFVRPHSATRHHKYWIYQTICQAKPIKFIIKTIYRSQYFMGQTRCPSKSLVIKSRFLSKLDKTFSTFNMVAAPSFSGPYLCKRPPLHSPLKIRSSTFTSLFHPYLFINSYQHFLPKC